SAGAGRSPSGGPRSPGGPPGGRRTRPGGARPRRSASRPRSLVVLLVGVELVRVEPLGEVVVQDHGRDLGLGLLVGHGCPPWVRVSVYGVRSPRWLMTAL